MCSSKSKGGNIVAKINGRPVLQPKSNQVPTLERRNSLKKDNPQSQPSPPISPKPKSPQPLTVVKRGNDPNRLNSSNEKALTIKNNTHSRAVETCSALNYSSSVIVKAPGSIAAARREQVSIMQEQRKLKIAHYGRANSANKIRPLENTNAREEKRCSFITPSSDPIYVAYHDQEWGVPVHDDMILFELLVLTGAQVGSDWTSVLKKRQSFREAFAGFDAEIVAKFNEKKIASISADYGMEISQVRGIADNSNRILRVKKEYGSFDKYLWGFVNHKPITNQYKSSNKIPVKSSKSESISKDMVKRGFRYVGPTVIHSFMQAAGLINDHLITCPRQLQCLSLASN